MRGQIANATGGGGRPYLGRGSVRHVRYGLHAPNSQSGTGDSSSRADRPLPLARELRGPLSVGASDRCVRMVGIGESSPWSLVFELALRAVEPILAKA